MFSLPIAGTSGFDASIPRALLQRQQEVVSAKRSVTAARLLRPSDVAVDSAGNVFIADALNDRVRKVTPGGIITTIAGTGTGGFSGDGGPATSAQLVAPNQVVLDGAGNLFIAEYNNGR